MSPVELLELRIAQSGLSNREFAEQWMVVDERTLRRWLGGSPIPQCRVDWLQDPPPWWFREYGEGDL